MSKKFFLKTFGCQQNVADSERVERLYLSRGFLRVEEIENADIVIINTCVIRDKAEERVYGMVRSLTERLGKKIPHIVVTGCLVGSASREPSGKMMKRLRSRLPEVEFLPMEEVGFEYVPVRAKGKSASIVISNGCNNYCAFCIVPFSRGKERSRAFEDIVSEAKDVVSCGYEEIVLLGQNVNSYGADFLQEKLREGESYELPNRKQVKPIMVKHLGRHRIPTLFPYLLEAIAEIKGLKKVTFISSNPWDFSDELIDVMAKYDNIDRVLHLPIQSGSNEVLKRMNRWYTREEYLDLIYRIKTKIPNMRFTTDIIVGFPGETRAQFEESIDIVKRVGFIKTFIAWYSSRPGTSATKGLDDNISIEEKQKRFHELDAIAFKGKNTLIR